MDVIEWMEGNDNTGSGVYIVPSHNYEYLNWVLWQIEFKRNLPLYSLQLIIIIIIIIIPRSSSSTHHLGRRARPDPE